MIKHISTFLFSLATVCLAPRAMAVPDLPQAIDIPVAPSGAKSPGGKGLPGTVREEPDEAAPAISAISETTFPDETLVITGRNLAEADLLVWHEGGTKIVKPLRAEENKMLAVLPDDMPVSTLLVWPHKGDAVGYPIRVNGSSAWWLWPRRAESTARANLRIIGRNLSLAKAKPVICLDGPGGTTILQPTSVEPYQLQVALPPALVPGHYTVRTHNGTGGVHGWSEPLQFEIVQDMPQPKTVFRPEDFGAKADDRADDIDAIQQAVDAAGTAGGGIVRFGEGEYAVSRPILVTGDAIRLEGIGKGTYDAGADRIIGPHTCIRRLDETDHELPEAIVVLQGDGCGLRNLALSNNHNGKRQNVVRITGRKAEVSNVLLTMFDKRDWENGELGPPRDSDLGPPTAQDTPKAPAAAGLLGQWDFDGEGMAVQDSSGQGNAGELHGIRVAGSFGKAVRFPHRALARVPGERLCPTKALTISAWFMSDSPDYETIRTIIRKDLSYALRFANGRLGFLLWHQGRVFTLNSPTIAWRDDEWHHLCATFEGQTMVLYLDGEPWCKRTLKTPIQIDTCAEPLHIGGLKRMSLHGVLDRVRIHGTALAEHDVRAEFAATKPTHVSSKVETSAYVAFRNPDKAIGLLDTGALQLHTKGSALASIHDCEIHCVGPGIEISPNIFTRARMDPSNPEPMETATSDVLVQRCTVRGYYGGEPDRLSSAGASGRTVGVVIHNGKRIIVEHCDFASANRYHRRILNRTMLSLNTGNRWLYFAHNTSKDVGTHSSATGMDRNQGEQYLIHYRYVPGGLFRVASSTATRTVIDTRNLSLRQEDPEYQSKSFLWNPMGSAVPAEVGRNGHWVLFVSHGRGVGQYRQIAERADGKDSTSLTLDKPWRVVPDKTSRVHLVPIHRNMILYANTVDGGQQVLTAKTHGVTFWYWTFDTIVAGNTFRNMTAGVVYNSRYAGPCGWNLVRDNTIEKMWGYTGDTSEQAALYVDHYRPHKAWAAPEDRVWYSVGNICRANQGGDSAVAAFLHRRPETAVRELVSGPETDSGIVLSVIENNDFSDVERGIVVSAPTNCCLLRRNRVLTRNHGASAVEDVSPKLTDCTVLP